MYKNLLITFSLLILLSCTQQSQQEVKAVDSTDQSDLVASKTQSWEERCEMDTSNSEPQVSTSSAVTSKPLKDAKPAERQSDDIKEVPNRFPTPEEIQKCRDLKKSKQDDN